MKNFKYYIALILELVGIIVVSAGLYEMIIMDIFNPASFLITSGSVIIAVGSLIFCKIINWGSFIQNCRGCYKYKRK